MCLPSYVEWAWLDTTIWCVVIFAWSVSTLFNVCLHSTIWMKLSISCKSTVLIGDLSSLPSCIHWTNKTHVINVYILRIPKQYIMPPQIYTRPYLYDGHLTTEWVKQLQKSRLNLFWFHPQRPLASVCIPSLWVTCYHCPQSEMWAKVLPWSANNLLSFGGKVQPSRRHSPLLIGFSLANT